MRDGVVIGVARNGEPRPEGSGRPVPDRSFFREALANELMEIEALALTLNTEWNCRYKFNGENIGFKATSLFIMIVTYYGVLTN